MTPRLALFDCDGTLVDSLAGIVAAMREAWAASGLPEPDPDAVRRLVGLPLSGALARLLPECTPGEIEAVAGRYRDCYHAHRSAGLHEDRLFDGAAEAMTALEAAGAVLGIATGKSTRGLLAVLERHGIRGRFATLQTADACRGKPDPEMVMRATAETGVRPADTVVIGDTVYDIGMARAAGARAVGVAWGYHTASDLSAAGSDAVIAEFAALPAVFEALVPPRPVAPA